MLLASRRPVVDLPVRAAVSGELMKGPSVLKLVRNRAGFSWLMLVAATVVSWAVGAEHGTGSMVAVVVWPSRRSRCASSAWTSWNCATRRYRCA